MSGVALFLTWYAPGATEQVIPPSAMTPVAGYSYHAGPLQFSVPLLYEVAADTNDAPLASSLVVLEDDAPIGVPHTIHDAIANRGSGTYSHWGNGLYFSASDNSDPRLNGRRYSVRVPFYPSAPLRLASITLGLLTAVLLVGTEWQRWLKVFLAVQRINSGAEFIWIAGLALTLYYSYLFNWRFDAFPIASPDTHGYLQWQIPFRTPGFPFFTWIFDLLAPNSWRYFALVQVVCIITGLTVLCAGISSLIRSSLVAAALLWAIASLDGVMAYSQMVLTEALFTTVVCLSVGLALLGLETRRGVLTLGAGGFMAYAAAIKPVGLAMPLGLVYAALPFVGRRLGVMVSLLAPSVLYQVAFSTYCILQFGTASSSLAGYALFGHVGWAMTESQPSRYPDLTAHLTRTMAPLVGKRPTFSSVSDYSAYTTNEYNALLWGTAVPAAQRWLQERGQPASREDLAEVLMTLARETIREHPRRYGYHVFAHYYACWDGIIWEDNLIAQLGHSAVLALDQYEKMPDLWRDRFGADGLALRALARKPPPLGLAKLPFDSLLTTIMSQETTTERLLLLVRRPVWIASLLLLLIGPVVIIRDASMTARTTRLVAGGLIVSVVVNIYFVTHASAQVYLSRYAGVMAPLVAALAALLVALAWHATTDLLRARSLSTGPAGAPVG